ncbi:hypothetical protein TNIN_229861 [Trichonephila inaurata madagascariensis]|uniref:Uncharacterized protein n=1 Tax=Trichonephila inaurata madagascariensis TaxID=2747483 RepID=A0A8X6XGY4_9ARAC|nr:hypothetical protein TNIN_229861 [Trichonephila inaurata madagascariensis]
MSRFPLHIDSSIGIPSNLIFNYRSECHGTVLITPYNFCYACGEMTFAAQKRTISPVVKTAYFLSFGVKLLFLYDAPDEDGLVKTFACIPSAIQPVPHSADMPIPAPPKKYEIVKDYVEEEEFIRDGTFHEPDFEAEDLKEPCRLN